MSHRNVATFIGCLLSESRAAFLHEYCSRGTLEDVLSNTELELDWVFKLSFALDAAEGMSYLHSRKIVHGRLSTTTCTVNEQWTLKIKGSRNYSRIFHSYESAPGTAIVMGAMVWYIHSHITQFSFYRDFPQIWTPEMSPHLYIVRELQGWPVGWGGGWWCGDLTQGRS